VCPTWLGFLNRVCSGDPEMIRYLQQVAGYALTGETGEHCLFYLYGRGRNGKSVFLNMLQWLLGDYAITVPSNLLTLQAREQHPTGLADLHGRRFVSTIEVKDGSRFDESMVKSMTGGDSVRARHMYKDFFEFSPEFKLFIAANHKLVIDGTDEGIWSRIRLIPFLETIPEEERDPRLAEKLRDEAEGVLAWAVQGCLEWQKYGLYEPEAVRRATAEYREESDSVGEFLASCCIFEPGASIGARDLFNTYSRWSYEAGRDQVGQKLFARSLAERGIEKRKRSGYHYIGLGLREDARETSQP
jgi:putative DNA primase/helicase